MKQIYLALIALGTALGANAQTFNYKIDSNFNSKGYWQQAIPSTQNSYAGAGACLLYDDGKMYTSHHFIQVAGTSAIPSVTNYIVKRKANGTIDSSYSNDGVQGNQYVGITEGRFRELFKIQNNGFYAVTEATWGGACTNNDSDTGVTNQLYSNLAQDAGSQSIQVNDSVIVTCRNTEINAYINNRANGYANFTSNYFADVMSSNAGNAYPAWSAHFPACFSDPNNNIYNTESPLYPNMGSYKDGRFVYAAGNNISGTTTFSGIAIMRTKANTAGIPDSSFGTNGFVALVNDTFDIYNANNQLLLDWRQTLVSDIKTLSNNTLLVAYVDFTAPANQRYKLAKLTNSGTIDNAFGTSGYLSFPSYISCINIDNQENIFLTHDSTIVDAYTSNGSPLMISGTSNRVVFSRPDVSNLVIVNSSMNSNGDILLCGYQYGTVWSQTLNNYGTDAIVIKTKRATTTTPNAITNVSPIESFHVYPNPSNHLIQFQLPNYTSNATLVITAMNGKKMQPITINKNTLDISSYPSGIYSLTVIESDKVYVSKFAKQ